MKIFKYIKILLTILFFAGILYFIRQLDFGTVLSLFVRSNKILFLIGVCTYLLSLVFKIIRLKVITHYYNHPIKLKHAATIQLVGISLAILTPGRLGEFSKIFMLKQHKISTSKSFSLIVFERLFDIIFLGLASFLFAALIIKNQQFTIILAIFSLIGIFALFFIKKIHLLSHICPRKYKNIIAELENLQLQKNLPLFTIIILFTIATWVVDAMLQWFFALSIGVHINILLILGVLCISNIVALVSILPAGIGTMDLSVLYLYSLAGLSPEIATSLLLVERFFGLVSPFVLALIMVKITGLKVKEIRRKTEQMEMNDE